MERQMRLILEDINLRYSLLSSLSNDELRSSINKIKEEIRKSPDNKKLLNDYLPEVYALIKETERRFTLGDVVVTATEQDVKNSRIYNFVIIEGSKAIYKNQWFIRGNNYSWGMIPYDEQILGGIYLHYGYATEMATGEGKTLVTVFPAFLNALSGKGVHVITSNNYLSERDYEQTRPIYLFHGMSVSYTDRKHDNIDKKEAYNNDITFGSISTFIFDYLSDQLALRKESINITRPYNFAIIDELDSILIDEAQTPHIIGGGCFYNIGADYIKYKETIENLIKDKSLYLPDFKNRKISFTEKGIEWLRKELGINDLFEYSKIYKISYFNDLTVEQRTEIENHLRLQEILHNLLNAYIIYTKDKDYVVENNKIVIIDENTGRLKPSSRWEHGLHTAVEIKENVKAEEDFDGLAVISVKNFLLMYDSVCGMSGTIMQVEKELNDIYNISSVAIPTHRPMIRKDNPVRVFKTLEDKDEAIINLIREIHKDGRPILVGCSTEKRNEDICSLLKACDIPFQKLSAKTLEKENFIISKAGEYGAITISTSIAGRGTDIKLSDKARIAGGLYVIGTEMFNSLRIDRQLKGRAGRQGDPGDSQFFVSVDDDIIKWLPENEDFKSFMSYGKSEITCPETIALTTDAQYEKEKYLYKNRIEVSRKDDTVDVFRQKFYKERMSFLMDTDSAKSKIQNLKLSSHDEIILKEHLHNLYEMIRNHAVNVIENEKIENEIKLGLVIRQDGSTNQGGTEVIQYEENHVDLDILFSENQNLFTLTFDRNKIVQSEEYFHDEFYRQIMLLTYDKYWGDFVKHILSDLDRTEIDNLPVEYDHLYENIYKVISKRIKDSVIPVNFPAAHPKHFVNEYSPINKRAEKTPEPNDPCPCGSGKKYCECHGKHNIRNTRRRR